MKVLYFLHGFLISFLVLIMSASIVLLLIYSRGNLAPVTVVGILDLAIDAKSGIQRRVDWAFYAEISLFETNGDSFHWYVVLWANFATGKNLRENIVVGSE